MRIEHILVLGTTKRMLRHDTLLVYGPKETFGIYKNMGNRAVYFTLPTDEARQPSGRKVVARKVYTDFCHSPKLKKLSMVEFAECYMRLCVRLRRPRMNPEIYPETYLGNRTNRYRRLLQHIDDV